ncbi:Rcb2.42 [Cyathus striatus]|nr:Rcb2.42 [Cyathus striatus]
MRVELPVGAFIAAFLVLVPLPWHWRARNVPTLSIIIWLFFCNLSSAINTIIWAGNVKIVAPVWCDIVTKLQIGATMALPACCLCLCIRLERISAIREANATACKRRQRVFFDLFMCWGLPAIHMALHYIVQGHRFDIVEDFGCRASIYSSVQALLLVWILPLLTSFLTLVYAAFALVHFFRRRISFSKHLQESASALTASRYLRLMAMAIIQMFWGVLLISINIWFTCKNGLRPWTGWADIHFNFSRIGLFPTIIIPEYVVHWTSFIWWTIPISSLLFFAFFSFGEEAMKEYRACWRAFKRIFTRRKSSTKENSIVISLGNVNGMERTNTPTIVLELKSQLTPRSEAETISAFSSYSDCLPSLGHHAV